MEQLISIDANTLQPFISNPESIASQAIPLQIAIASYPETPRSLLEILAKSDTSAVAEAAQLHVNYAGELNADWQIVVDEKLKSRYLGQNDRVAVELLKFAPVPDYFLSEWVPANYLIQGLRNPHLPWRYRLRLLERLAQEPTLEPRLQVAESPETPLPVLEQLVGDLELPVRLAVQYNPSCPPELVRLVQGQHQIADDWDTNADQLTSLGSSSWDWIRLAVAQNPSTSEETLMKLAGDEVFRIQLAVAKNPATPATVLSKLAERSEREIPAAVAIHPKATEEILHRLFPTHQGVIKSRQDLPASILERVFNEAQIELPLWNRKNSSLRYFFFRQQNTPTWILEQFADVDIEAVRQEKAALRQPPPEPELLQKWVVESLDFLADIAKHPQVSVEILARLAKYPNPKVQFAVAQHSKTPEELRVQLLKDLAVHPDYKIRTKVAEDLHTPVFTLETMAQDEFYHPKLLKEIRRVLAAEYPEHSHSYPSLADVEMSDLKRKDLYPANISVNVDRWMEIIGSPRVIEAMRENYRADEIRQALNREMLLLFPSWKKLLLGLPEEAVKKVIKHVVETLAFVNGDIKNDHSTRSVAVALVGNPNTPVNIREQLKNELIRPNLRVSRYQSDRDVLTALAGNFQLPESEREEYFQRLIAEDNWAVSTAKNSLASTYLLEKLFKVSGEIEKSRDIHEALAKNPQSSPKILKQLARLPDDIIRYYVAKNPSTSVETLLALSEDSDRQVRETALKNSNLSPNKHNEIILGEYKLEIALEQQEQIEQANQILVQRTDSPYALARVLETGDRNAKISAARNRKTPTQVLEQLARDQDITVRKIVAENPNLPLNSFLELAQDTSIKVRLTLAYKSSRSKITTPVQLLEQLAQDESEQVRATVAEHPDTPVEILVRLANDSSLDVKKKLTANLNTPVTVLNRLGLEENIVNPRNPNTPGMVLAQAVKRMGSKALTNFIKHPVKGTQMPAETLSELANHQVASVRYQVAAHPNTSHSTLEQLARDSYIATIRAVASNPNTPSSALKYLANNPDLTTLLSIVRNPNTPARVLTQIVENAQRAGNASNRTKDTLKSAFPGNAYDLLQAIAANPLTPAEALEILARREFVSPPPDPKSILPPKTDADVMRSLAYNPSLTPELINILTQDPCVDVRIALTRHPNLTEALWRRLTEDSEISVRKAIASKTSAPISILEILAQDTATDVRVEVAGNNQTPNDVLEQLSQDEEAALRTKVAANPNTADAVLEHLAQDEKVEVRRAVAQNPQSSASIRHSLQDLLLTAKTPAQPHSPTLRGLSRIYNPNTDDIASVLSEYVESEVAFVRFVSLLHPLSPIEVLRKRAQSVSWIERYAVADNPATPQEIKQQLTQDSNQIVRAVAMNNLAA